MICVVFHNIVSVVVVYNHDLIKVIVVVVVVVDNLKYPMCVFCLFVFIKNNAANSLLMLN